MINTDQLTEKQLAAMFDHTFLKAYASEEDLKKLCNEAKELGAAMVAVNSSPVAFCKKQLEGTGIHVGAAISFPLGQTALETKIFETKKAIEDGADEIDYVMNVGEMKNGNLAYIEEEMRRITAVCHEKNVICKVIFENCYLSREEIRAAARIAARVRPDYIKTSTGFGTGGARVEDVKLMKETVGQAVRVKAAGGIRDWATCKKMIEAGAERIGTSSSFRILEGFRDCLLPEHNV